MIKTVGRWSGKSKSATECVINTICLFERSLTNRWLLQTGTLELPHNMDLEKDDALDLSQVIPQKNFDVAPMEEDLAVEMVPSNGSPSDSDEGGREDSHPVTRGRGSSLSGGERTRLRLLGVQRVKERLAKDHVKLNPFALINKMRRASIEKSLLRIPLCRFVHMPMVR